MADLEQQIFDYLPGVGPERVIAIREALQPHEIDLGTRTTAAPTLKSWHSETTS
jgi:DNA helicase-2/ATP-dependent DNA helicase PcrA